MIKKTQTFNKVSQTFCFLMHLVINTTSILDQSTIKGIQSVLLALSVRLKLKV